MIKTLAFRKFKLLIAGCFVCLSLQQASASSSKVLTSLQLGDKDSILVTSSKGIVLGEWQVEKPLVPASLSKLATAHLAIQKWGLDHSFYTDFYLVENTLWIKGYGDPYVVSEEFDRLIPRLESAMNVIGLTWQEIDQIKLDNSYFDIKSVPGRSSVSDPYNAPLSAISANFNTVNLIRNKGVLRSAETQTPLTATAKRVAKTMVKQKERVNLRSSQNAQSNFAELLIAKSKFGLRSSKVARVRTDAVLPVGATLLYRHVNSASISKILRGTLEFSNNFMANHVFLKLAENADSTSVSFKSASEYAQKALARELSWRNHSLIEGSGLSRQNRLSASQIDDLLVVLEPNKTLFKKIKVSAADVDVYAKTGTLSGVRSYAGYIDINVNNPDKRKSYRFVFNFNRTVPYRYREAVLEQLINDLRALK